MKVEILGIEEASAKLRGFIENMNKTLLSSLEDSARNIVIPSIGLVNPKYAEKAKVYIDDSRNSVMIAPDIVWAKGKLEEDKMVTPRTAKRLSYKFYRCPWFRTVMGALMVKEKIPSGDLEEIAMKGIEQIRDRAVEALRNLLG